MSSLLDDESGPEIVKGLVYKVALRSRLPVSHAAFRRRRLIVLDRRLGKLFIVKHEATGTENDILDQIDLCSASFTMDHGDSGFFSIHLGDSSYEFDAVTHDQRLIWLKHLQRTRAGGIRRKSRSGTRMNPKVPVLKSVDIESLPWIDDPAGDENNGLSAMASATPGLPFKKKLMEPEFGALQDFGKRVARSIGLNSDDNRTQFFLDAKEDNSMAVDISPPVSPMQPSKSGLRNFGRRVKSFRFGSEVQLPKPVPAPALPDCRHCSKLHGQLRSVEEDLKARGDENSALRQSVELLRDQCDSLIVEKDNLLKIQELLSNGSGLIGPDALEMLNGGHILEILREKDSKLIENEQKLAAVMTRLEVYEELVRVKDEAIACLVNGNTSSAGDSTPGLNKPVSAETVQTDMSCEELNELFRTVATFGAQTDFLTEEVKQLGNLLHEAAKREDKALAASREWEAKFYQVQSKYLSLLNDLHAPPEAETPGSSSGTSGSNGKRPGVISRLVQDVVDSQDERALETRLPIGGTRSGLYDELGFLHQSIDYAGHPGDRDMSRILSLRDRADDIKYEMTEKESPEWRASWDAFLLAQDLGDGSPRSYPDSKILLRRGIPLRDRGRVWSTIVRSRHQDEFASGTGSSTRYYFRLLEEFTSKNGINPVVKQIELDLTRTLPNNRHYESSRADGIPRLRRVLLAFSMHRPDVGYCQGLNRIAAVALLFMSEEDSFWTLCDVVERLMPPDYYTRTLFGAQVDQKVFKEILTDKLPRLAAHLTEHNVDITLFTFNWFLCIFVDNVPTRTYLRIWDTFLYEGSKVLFRYAIAAFLICEREILALKDHVSIFSYMRNIGESLTDVQRLTEVAFNELNPFSMKHIRNLREKHAVGVKAQLEELEAQRRNFKPKSEAKNGDGARSDDD